MNRRKFLKQGLGFTAGILLLLRSRFTFAEDQKFEVVKTDAEWKQILTPEQYAVLRQHDTEPPYTSRFEIERRKGTYSCAGCDLPLFSSSAKYDSGTGWPSFTAPLPDAIGTQADNDFAEQRIEVHCHRCGGHLGHRFDDGPPPTGKRYCMNGVALKFMPETPS